MVEQFQLSSSGATVLTILPLLLQRTHTDPNWFSTEFTYTSS